MSLARENLQAGILQNLPELVAKLGDGKSSDEAAKPLQDVLGLLRTFGWQAHHDKSCSDEGVFMDLGDLDARALFLSVARHAAALPTILVSATDHACSAAAFCCSSSLRR